MDEVDQANIASSCWERSYLAQHQLSVKTGFISARVCADCGESIPETRREAIPGCTRCAACQEAADE